jgi:hypothetical protein
VKTLLSYNGFDNVVTIQRIDEQDLAEIEEFARSTLPKLVDMKNPEDYYFIYGAMPNNFRFVPGHKKLIFGIRDYVRNKGADWFSALIRRKVKTEMPMYPHTPIVAAAVASSPIIPTLSAAVSLASPVSMNSPVSQNSGFTIKSIGTAHSSGSSLPPPKRKVSSSRDDNERRLLETINAYIERAQAVLNDGCDYTIKKVTILFNQNEEAMSAGVYCSICKNIIKIGTQSNLSGRRWIISNYVRHFRRHFPIFAQMNLSGNLSGIYMPCEQEMEETKHAQEEFEIYCNSDESPSNIKREKRDGDYMLTSTMHSDEGSSSQAGSLGSINH